MEGVSVRERQSAPDVEVGGTTDFGMTRMGRTLEEWLLPARGSKTGVESACVSD